jgi:hypothetical protein
MHPVSLGLSGRAISEAPVWKKSQEAGRPYSLSVRGPPYLVRRSLSVPGTQNRTEPNRMGLPGGQVMGCGSRSRVHITERAKSHTARRENCEKGSAKRECTAG